MATAPEIRLAGDLRNLPNNSLENLVLWGESHAPFDLDFKSGGVPGCVMRMHNDVIQWVTFGSSLEFDAINDRAGQASRLRPTSMHRR
ncbi:MAG: hypothetical protein LAP13_21615 [Acidobacteriia bacterium]|nr:hypothetical protein [Terriglobia bacterium]